MHLLCFCMATNVIFSLCSFFRQVHSTASQSSVCQTCLPGHQQNPRVIFLCGRRHSVCAATLCIPRINLRYTSFLCFYFNWCSLPLMHSHAGAMWSNWIVRFQLFGLLRIAGKTIRIHKLNAHIFDAVVIKVLNFSHAAGLVRQKNCAGEPHFERGCPLCAHMLFLKRTFC